MEQKYIQRNETRYSNNEYPNMPSIDYPMSYIMELTKRNRSVLDLDVIKEICSKYGFRYTFIDSTFAGDESHFILYLKTDLDADKYDAMRKNIFTSSKEEQMKYFALSDRYDSTFMKMHDCINELDVKTQLYFRNGWVGNCGLFGSDDVNRVSYLGGRWLYSWEQVNRWFSPNINDTMSKLSKGVYVMAESMYLKIKCDE